MLRIICLLTGLLLITSLAYAGGVDPKEMPVQEPVKKEKVTATPAQTSAAVSKARSVVAPVVKEESVVAPQPKAAAKPRTVTTPKVVATPAATTGTGKSAWMLGNGNGACAQLSSIANKVKVGSFKTPQELALKMRQRGYQAFALDIGDTPDQLVRVKVPDKDLDLTFVRSELCR